MGTVRADGVMLGLWGHVRAMCVDVHDSKRLGGSLRQQGGSLSGQGV